MVVLGGCTSGTNSLASGERPDDVVMVVSQEVQLEKDGSIVCLRAMFDERDLQPRFLMIRVHHVSKVYRTLTNPKIPAVLPATGKSKVYSVHFEFLIYTLLFCGSFA